jgi:hypothetical protein
MTAQLSLAGSRPLFHGHELGAEASPPTGRLIDVDLSDAVLRFVGFRNMSLDGVVPLVERDDQVVVRHYPCVVRRALARTFGLRLSRG